MKTLDLGLENRLRSKVGLLSGGQRQALTLLMATLKKPKVLLLDEHTAALDPKTAAKVLEISDRIIAEKNVRFQNGTQTGSSQKATYFASRNLLVLEGNPILHDGDNSIRGNVIRYYVNENRSVVEGGPKQRVHAVFSSNDKKGK